MTRKQFSRCASVLLASAILYVSLATAAAQSWRSANVKQTPPSSRGSHARTGRRTLVKIRARAGDTLGQLGDRFGATAEEIANLNGIAVSAELRPGQEILIPLPSPETLARPVADDSTRNASTEAAGEWVNVQGVLFRRGGAARAVEPSRAESSAPDVGEVKEKNDGTLAQVVDVSEAERSNASQPVLIYLVGGARVEADSVNETAEGVWYRRGNITVFIERSRVERIERERVVGSSDSNGYWTERGWTTGNAKLDALIRENGARTGVDPYLIFCVMEQESQFKPWVVSPKGAKGLMQLMPGTAARFGVRKPFDPADNIRGGTLYLKQLLENFGGRVDLVLAGYNAGEGAVMRYGGNVPPYRETRNYVQRISKRYGQTRSFIPDAKEAAPPGLR